MVRKLLAFVSLVVAAVAFVAGYLQGFRDAARFYGDKPMDEGQPRLDELLRELREVLDGFDGHDEQDE